jgi:heat-inducible transcriptional repressor
MDRVEQAIQHTTTILSQLTNYMTIILGPKISENKLKHLQVIPLFDRSAVSILVTDTGHVHQQRITVPEGVSLSTIEQLVNLLNYRLNGVSLARLKSVAARELIEEMMRHIDQAEKLLYLIDQMLHTDQEERVYTSGATKMLDQPEFRDIDKMKSLLDLMEESQTIIQLVEPRNSGVQVRIGHENPIEAVNDCSIISASYKINGEPVGTIAVLGPTRMDYGKVIGLIDFLAKDFSERLRTLYDGE